MGMIMVCVSFLFAIAVFISFRLPLATSASFISFPCCSSPSLSGNSSVWQLYFDTATTLADARLPPLGLYLAAEMPDEPPLGMAASAVQCFIVSPTLSLANHLDVEDGA